MRKHTDIHLYNDHNASGKSDRVQSWTMHEACSPVSSMHEIKLRRGGHRFSCTNMFLCALEMW